MNHLEIKHLRMVCAIAESGNMTKAAQSLFISQSALSQQLKDIESKLGIGLFFRTRKRMILTPMGKKLLETARHVIVAVEAAELEIAKVVSGDRGTLKVGTQCIFCYKWLPRVMRLFQDKFPNIAFEIGNAANLAEELETKKYDLVITAAAVQDDNFDYLPLFRDQMVCIMPKDHPLSGRSFVDFEDFNGSSLIVHAQKRQNRFYQLVLKPRAVEPKRMMIVGQPLAIIEMVASGFGLSIFPRWAVAGQPQTDGITARPITKNGFPLTWRAAYLKHSRLPVFQKEFINLVGKMNIAEPQRIRSCRSAKDRPDHKALF
jgi:LysR family transcriptional regulator, regulator for metE and metH